MKRLLFSILAALGLIVLMSAVALAHAKFVKSDPAPDSTVTTAPLTVTIWFDEELDTKQSSIKVVDAGGAQVDLGNSKVNLNERTQMAVGLKSPLANGVYTVSWHAVTADDGGITDGQFKFTVGAPAPATPSVPAAASATPTRAPGTPTVAPAASTTPSPAPTGTLAATASPSPMPAGTGTPVVIVSASPTAMATPTAAPATAATKAPSATPAPVPAANGDFDPATVLIIVSLVIVGAGAAMLLRRR